MGTEVIASLEGEKVVIDALQCELHEYNFVENVWTQVEARRWPLPRNVAELWLQGWNAVDRSKAFNLLTAPIPE